MDSPGKGSGILRVIHIRCHDRQRIIQYPDAGCRNGFYAFPGGRDATMPEPTAKRESSLKKECYDMTDAYVTCLAYMKMKGEWD